MRQSPIEMCLSLQTYLLPESLNYLVIHNSVPHDTVDVWIDLKFGVSTVTDDNLHLGHDFG